MATTSSAGPPALKTPCTTPMARRFAVQSQRRFKWQAHILAGLRMGFSRTTTRCTWLLAVVFTTCYITLAYSRVLSREFAVSQLLAPLLVLIDLLLAAPLLRIIRMQQAPHRLHPKMNHPRGKPLLITVLGPFARPALIACSASDTIHTVLHILETRHLIGDFKRVTYDVLFPKYQHSGIAPSSRLGEIGVSSGCTLHVRPRLLGGSSSGLSGVPATVNTHFGRHRGRFPSDRADVWDYVDGQYRCRICPGSFPMDSKHIKQHERSAKHHKNLKQHDHQRNQETHHETFPVAGPSDLARVRGPLREIMSQMNHPAVPVAQMDIDPPPDTVNDIAWDNMDFTGALDGVDQPDTNLWERLGTMLADNDSVGSSSSEAEQERSDEGSSDEGSEPDNSVPLQNIRQNVRVELDNSRDNPWFPWPSKETCVLDILRHLPRCAFSRKQNTAIHWAMVALGVPNLPTDRQMDSIDESLQKLCGIDGIRYQGKLGHIYYVNDMRKIIAQEMANPRVREHLHFYPDDSAPSLSEAWQADRWLKEMAADLTTPVLRVDDHDYFIHEPALLLDGTACIPTRWFTRNGDMQCKAWGMKPLGDGWVVDRTTELDVAASRLLLNFPEFIAGCSRRALPDPRNIVGLRNQTGDISPWTLTDPNEGNPWRKKAGGKRVVAFPIWLYCDDTSGNLSKKWNKHNSFLFTPAGLPRRYVHRESNIHFLSTSNIAPPLEMLDGIVDQLEDAQANGIVAWDSVYKEFVLVIPSVLAMVGDNPMQSEFACHIGFRGREFCRVCKVSGTSEGDDEDHDGPAEPDTASVGSATSDTDKPRRKKKQESMEDMITRITSFLQISTLRDRKGTIDELRSQFTLASRVGGKQDFQKAKTKSGVKDTFQAFFIDKIFAISTRRKVKKQQRETEVANLLKALPADTISPVWRIKDLDPHTDTPVEILHVILLGFVKYFWRDAVNRLDKDGKDTLIARLSSINISGLGIDALSGRTLVTYAGSLTGRDFRCIVQVAPFVLHGLMPQANIDAWAALSALVTLVWQPEIENIDQHLVEVKKAIDHFLLCTCRLTPRWFNKPKFHVILHLPEHIRRFGPAMLFATEGFESFNAIIRGCSVHSNRHAPSKDIAYRMARGNRIRHLLSGGFFCIINRDRQGNEQEGWHRVQQAPLSLLSINSFSSNILGLDEIVPVGDGASFDVGPIQPLSRTQSASSGLVLPVSNLTARCHTPAGLWLRNGDRCRPNDWVVWSNPHHGKEVGQVVEAVEIMGSPNQQIGRVDWVLVKLAIPGAMNPTYALPTLRLSGALVIISAVQIIHCTVNVQHNCHSYNCPIVMEKPVRQEREVTAEKQAVVRHQGDNTDYVLNLAQMRDAAVLASFRLSPPALNRTEIIAQSVRTEIDLRKAKNLTASAATTAAPLKAKSTKRNTLLRTSTVVGHTVTPSDTNHPTAIQFGHPVMQPPSQSLSHPVQMLPVHHHASMEGAAAWNQVAHQAPSHDSWCFVQQYL